jgi:hypothetical protein
MTLDEMLKKDDKVLTLPKSGLEVELKAVYLKDLFEILKITSSKHDSLITSLMTVTMKRIGTNNKVTSKDIDAIPARDLMWMQEKLDEVKLQGTIDTSIQTDCSNCKKEFEVKLNCMDASFFVPTKGSINSTI